MYEDTSPTSSTSSHFQFARGDVVVYVLCRSFVNYTSSTQSQTSTVPEHILVSKRIELSRGDVAYSLTRSMSPTIMVCH